MAQMYVIQPLGISEFDTNEWLFVEGRIPGHPSWGNGRKAKEHDEGLGDEMNTSSINTLPPSAVMLELYRVYLKF
jgi:hypothetical protein